MSSPFLLQIVHRGSSTVVHLEPGRQAERDLVTDIVKRAVVKGVGFFRTQAQVEIAIREAIEEAIFDLKRQIVP